MLRKDVSKPCWHLQQVPGRFLLPTSPNGLTLNCLEESEGGGCDEHRRCRGRSRRTGRLSVPLWVSQNLAKLFSRLEQACALACHVFGEVQPGGGRLVPLDPPDAVWFIRHRHPDLY